VNNIWQGELVRLRGIEPGDWETHFAWDQDSELSRRLDRVFPPKSAEATREWAARTATRDLDGDNYFFEIENRAGELVGSMSTQACNPRNGTFEYGVAVRDEHKRKGYANEAIRLVLRYYFQELRYQKAIAWVYSFNTPSIRLHEALGFQQEGRLRRMIYTDGQWFDNLVFGITMEEFAARYAQPPTIK
jgi:RimJ/RimL family protein N-acetyltransferase